MSGTKSYGWYTSGRPPWTHPWRRLTAAVLRAASGILAWLAYKVSVPEHLAPEVCELPLGIIEFHWDGSAPEGALYIDGELVGWLEGVKRL